MTYDQAETLYIGHIDQAHGKAYAATVGRFQEGFLRDKVTNDCNEAFRRGVECAERLLPTIKLRARA